MSQEHLSEFSGICGRVLHKSVSWRSLASGIALTFVLFVGNWVMSIAGASQAALPFNQLVFALALSRFAVNGHHGEWTGTLFSNIGGSWFHVGFVATRFLFLTGLWLIPMMIFGALPGEEAIAAMMMTGSGAGRLFGFVGLYIVAMTLTPPVLLIISVSARNFGELLSPLHWRQTFSGRITDLFMIYAVYTGGVGMVLVLSIPLVLIGFMGNQVIGWVLAAGSFGLLMGVSANLLGRLCGFFACGDLGVNEEPILSQPISSGPVPVQPMHAAPTPAVPAPPAPRAVSIPLSGGGAPAAAAATARVAEVAPVAAAADTRPALLEAGKRIAVEMQRFERDPQGAIAALQEMHGTYALSPQVLQALCICKHRAGQVDESVALAQEALPLCFERGHSLLAAQIFKELRPQLAQLELGREQLLVIGASLAKADDLAAAAKAYSSVIGLDAGEMRAVKGLLTVADDILHKKGSPSAAVKVYRYLVKHCSDSPLAEYMIRGLQEAERKLAT